MECTFQGIGKNCLFILQSIVSVASKFKSALQNFLLNSKGTQALSELWWSKMHLVRCVDPNGGVHVPADGLSLPVGMRYIIYKIR